MLSAVPMAAEFGATLTTLVVTSENSFDRRDRKLAVRVATSKWQQKRGRKPKGNAHFLANFNLVEVMLKSHRDAW